MLQIEFCVFFFFKQKTAYEIKECDWSSDVCSSDLWQIELFLEIFNENKFFLEFRDLKKNDISAFKDTEIHIFLVDSIPPLYFDFLSKLENVYLYSFSPCAMFFEDIVSDREKKSIKKLLVKQKKSKKNILEVEKYLKNRNSFLANMSKVKRSYLKIVNSYESREIKEKYIPYFDIESFTSDSLKSQNDGQQSKLTLLQTFQNDILFLKNRENKFPKIFLNSLVTFTKTAGFRVKGVAVFNF